MKLPDESSHIRMKPRMILRLVPVFSICMGLCHSFATAPLLNQHKAVRLRLYNSKDHSSSGESAGQNSSDFAEHDLQAAGLVLEDLSWRVDKLRLEEENTRRFLKAKPRFLPYEECRKWVQAFSRWKSEEDWRSWIAMGEKRNSYIPSRPDDYYSKTGDWISWDHFLGIDSNENTSTERKPFLD